MSEPIDRSWHEAPSKEAGAVVLAGVGGFLAGGLLVGLAFVSTNIFLADPLAGAVPLNASVEQGVRSGDSSEGRPIYGVEIMGLQDGGRVALHARFYGFGDGPFPRRWQHDSGVLEVVSDWAGAAERAAAIDWTDEGLTVGGDADPLWTLPRSAFAESGG